MKKISEKLGWVGTFLIILAYALLSFGIIQAHSFWYQFLNLIGSVSLIIDTYYKKDLPPELLNIIWTIIAFVSLVSILFIK